MAHILILGQWKARIIQLEELSDTLHDNIENNMYSGKQLEDANALMSAVESSVAGDLNASTIDGVISNLENFLGI